MLNARLTCAVVTTMQLAPAIAVAHHNTGALFDLDAEIVLEGVVAEYEWANPHVYIYVDVAGAGGVTTWEVEAGPVAFMKRLGWTPDSLRAGDAIVLTGNPARRANRQEAYLVSAIRAGDAMPATRGDAFVALMEEAPGTAMANGLAGTWATVLDPDAIGRFEAPEEGLPLTKNAIAAVAQFDEATMSPGLDCVPYTAPLLMLVPDTKQIEVRPDRVRIRSEFDGTERIVHIGGESEPGTVQPSVHGRAIGRWEDGALVIETSRFAPHRSGLGFGLPSGGGKRLTEVLELDPDGTRLTYRFELEDPEYLSEPVGGEAVWAYRPDLEYSEITCDPDNARRFATD